MTTFFSGWRECWDGIKVFKILRHARYYYHVINRKKMILLKDARVSRMFCIDHRFANKSHNLDLRKKIL